MNEVNVKKALTIEAGALFDSKSEANNNALQEVLRFITTNTQDHSKMSMKTLKDRFKDAPYGFVDDDIHYLVARLFKKGELAFTVNGENVTIHSHSVDDIFNFITKKGYMEKLMMECKERISDSDKKKVRTLLKEVFNITDNSEDEDVLMSAFIQACENKQDKLTEYKLNYGQNKHKYPGYQTIEGFSLLLSDIKRIKSSKSFYGTVIDKTDTFLDFADDIEAVEAFFKEGGNQKTIFDNAKLRVKIFEDNKTYITDEATKEIAGQISKIVNNDRPYTQIRLLPKLNDDFDSSYTEILDGHTETALKEVEAYQKQVMEMLKEKSYKDKYQRQYASAFEAIVDKANKSQSIIAVIGCAGEASFLAEQCMNQMAKLDAKLEAEKTKEESNKTATSGEKTDTNTKPAPNPKPVIQHRNVTIGKLLPARHYDLKTEADVDNMVEDLRKEIKKAMEENTVYHVTF
jgi:hypothetical protein